jgi:nicotinamide riboside transporter PnuC
MWLVTAASIVGTLANIYGRRWCFVVWMVTNILWVEYDVYKEAYPQAALMMVYALLAAWGYTKWATPSKKTNPKEFAP